MNKLLKVMILISLMGSSITGYAGETVRDYINVTIPIVMDSDNADNSWTCNITPDVSNIESDIKQDEITLSGLNDKGEFVVSFYEPGIYKYKIQQESNNKIMDATVYNVLVYVSHNSNGEFVAEYLVYEDNNETKKEEVHFLNKKSELNTGNSDNTADKTGPTGGESNNSGVVASGSVNNNTTGSLPVKTADDTPLDVYMGVFGLSALAMIVLFASRRRNRDYYE